MQREDRLLRKLIAQYQRELSADPQNENAARAVTAFEEQLAFFLREPELFRCNTFPPPPHLMPALKRELLREKQLDPNRSTSRKTRRTSK